MAMTAAKLEQEKTTRRAEKPEIKVVKGGRYGLNKAKQNIRTMGIVILAAVALGLLFTVVQRQALLTQLTGDIDIQRGKLTQAQSTYDYLSAKINSIENHSDVQAYAEGQLGMVAYDTSQVTYVQLEQDSVITKNSSDAAQLWNGFRTAALSLADAAR